MTTKQVAIGILVFIVGILAGLGTAKIVKNNGEHSTRSDEPVSKSAQGFGRYDSASSPGAGIVSDVPMVDMDLPMQTNTYEQDIIDDRNEQFPQNLNEPILVPTQEGVQQPLQIVTELPARGDTFSFAVGADDAMPLWIMGDTLQMSVSYSGGCAVHDFSLFWNETFLEMYPVQAVLQLVHNNNGDMCEAYPTETLSFDLAPLKAVYQTAYQTNSGSVTIILPDAFGQDQTILYTFK